MFILALPPLINWYCFVSLVPEWEAAGGGGVTRRRGQ